MSAERLLVERDPVLPDGYRWASVSRDMEWWTARARHAVPKRTAARDRDGWYTSLCGSTANDPAIFRGNLTKPVCTLCAAAIKRLEKDHAR